MSPREFLRRSRRSRLAETPSGPLSVPPGATVGVVLMTTGGPSGAADVEPFLYSRLMDPAETSWRMPVRLRHVAARLLARRRARTLGRAYEMIGGASPLAHHTREQAEALQNVLNRRFGAATGATFRTYTAMRHWHPTTTEAATAMAADGVTHTVLLPLHPQYAGATTGSSFAYWDALCASGAIAARPTARVSEYAAHPKYVQALAERVDEGLQRFPRESRSRVQVLFCAQGALHDTADRARDPYCCLVHATVQAVVRARAERDPERGVHVAFGKPLVRGRALAPEVRDTLRTIADDGFDAVLVVPVSFVTDRIETAYELDVVVRGEAAKAGIAHFEVTYGLNGHPLLLDALAECVASQIAPVAGGDGASALFALATEERPRHDPALRTVRCASCTFVAEPCVWPEPAIAPHYREAA